MSILTADHQKKAARESYEKYKAKIRSIIEIECDGSRMSNAKWKLMLDALRLLYPQASFYYRVKLLDEVEVSDWSWFSHEEHTGQDQVNSIWIEGCCYSPVQVIAVEYIEILPSGLCGKYPCKNKMSGSYQNQIQRQLDALNVPYTLEGDIIRVTGHIRRSSPGVVTGSR